MDILATPESPTFPVPRTKLVANPWDCGNFLSYAARKQLLHRVPVGLRQPDPAPLIPYLEPISHTPKAENEIFYQTWFYFGLIAECLGLNEGPLQDRSLAGNAPERLRAIVDQVTYEEGGCRFISGTRVLDSLAPFLAALSSPPTLSLGNSDEKPDILDRMAHLHSCLRLVHKMVLNGILGDFDIAIKFSIAAMAEIIATAAHYATTHSRFKKLVGEKKVGVFGFGSFKSYLEPGGNIEAEMVHNHWCLSDIERLRHTYNGLGTIHYVSRLNRPTRHDHSSCGKASCTAFQIDLSTYKLSHSATDCSCSEFEINIVDIQNTLRNTKTFPILRFQRLNDEVKLVVEDYKAGTEYVALSHVWADGLGNPRSNAIQQCQVIRLMDLINELEATEARDSQQLRTEPYRLWIDTLCCPVELSGKLIALERIKAVYKEASHVLVLDSSISSFACKDRPAAELLFRVLGTSSWMRRLWTLQEAVLAKSLCFQFSDGIVREKDLVERLLLDANRDVRWLKLYADADTELVQLHSFTGSSRGLPFRNIHQLLHGLQDSIYFRTVTIPSDEALCLSTLASLEITDLASDDDQERRMARVWQALSDRFDGVPARVIFYEDNTLAVKGFRWAPRSLLNAAAPSFHDLCAKVSRFHAKSSTISSSLGVSTPEGLCVRFPGCRVEVRPLVAGRDLHPWRGILKQPLEDRVYLKHKETGRWLSVYDWERSQAALVLSDDKMTEWYRKANNPICRAIDKGNAALIHDSTVSTSCTTSQHDMHTSLLVSVEESPAAADSTGGKLWVHKMRPLIFYPVSDTEAVVVDGLRTIAVKVAVEDVTAKLNGIANKESEEYKTALEEVRRRMKASMLEFWDATPAFASAVAKVFGPNMKEFIWAAVPKFCSHDAFVTDLPDDQVWLVD